MFRCPWTTTELYVQYHDTEWGVPVHVAGARHVSARPNGDHPEKVQGLHLVRIWM
jgi:hypothetical protein